MARSSTSFKPGESGNPAGKPKGAKNKETQQMDAFAAMLFEAYVENDPERKEELKVSFLKDWVQLEPKERIDIFLKTQEFRCGKRKSIDFGNDTKKNLSDAVAAVGDLLKAGQK